jgi:UDP-glucose 4-epimerase
MAEAKQHSKTILITGGLGYLGSQLIRDLATTESFSGWTIRILDNLQSGQYRALMQLPAVGQYQFIEGDLLDPSAVRLAVNGVEAVVHLAAIVRTPMSFERSQWVEQVNHWGTRHLLEASVEAGVKQFVFASSTAVYGPGGPYQETDRCRPQGAYAQSKQHAEEAILALARRGGLRPTILRFGTLFGLAPVTRFEAVANRLAYLAGVRRSVTVFGSGEQRRTLIHVADAGRAISLCLTQPGLTAGQLLNAASCNISILELIELIRRAEPSVNVRFTEQDIRTHLSFEADNSRLKELGWQPQVEPAAGLAEVIGQFSGFRAVLPGMPDVE